MDKKDSKKKLQEIVIAVLAGIVFVTALFIINNITENDNKTIEKTQRTTTTQKAAERTRRLKYKIQHKIHMIN